MLIVASSVMFRRIWLLTNVHIDVSSSCVHKLTTRNLKHVHANAFVIQGRRHFPRRVARQSPGPLRRGRGAEVAPPEKEKVGWWWVVASSPRAATSHKPNSEVELLFAIMSQTQFVYYGIVAHNIFVNTICFTLELLSTILLHTELVLFLNSKFIQKTFANAIRVGQSGSSQGFSVCAGRLPYSYGCLSIQPTIVSSNLCASCDWKTQTLSDS